MTLLIAGTCLAQTFSSLTFMISDKESGYPIENASVAVKEGRWASKNSDDKGIVSFLKSIPIGEIHFIVNKEGYQGHEGTFNITTEEKDNSLNIKLSKHQDNKLLISGEITDGQGRDFEGVTVEAKFANIVKTTKTDQSGNYFLEILNTTTYNVNQIKIEAKYSNGCKKSEMVDVPRNNIVNKDLKLDCTTGQLMNNQAIYNEKDTPGVVVDTKKLDTETQKGKTIPFPNIEPKKNEIEFKDISISNSENILSETEENVKQIANDALKALHKHITYLGSCKNSNELKAYDINVISGYFIDGATMEVSSVRGNTISKKTMPVRDYFIRLAYLCISTYKQVDIDFPSLNTSKVSKSKIKSYPYLVKGEFLQKFKGVFKIQTEGSDILTYSDFTLKITDIYVNESNGALFGNTVVLYTQKTNE